MVYINYNIYIHLQNCYFIFRGNKERLKQFGKSLSIRSRQYRAKRISVNVKVNALGYVVEMLGGMIIAALSFLKHAHVLYTVGMIWYGTVIPSCYLINFSHTKKSILEEGWTTGLSKLYQKKKPKRPVESNNPSKRQKRQPSEQVNINNEDNREASSEPSSEETRQETESDNVTASESTINDETISTIGSKRWDEKKNRGTTERLEINMNDNVRMSTKRNSQIILYDLEDTSSPFPAKFIENTKEKSKHCSSCLNCSVYHIS